MGPAARRSSGQPHLLTQARDPPNDHDQVAGPLRSARWFAPHDLRAFGHRSRIRQMGYGPED